MERAITLNGATIKIPTENMEFKNNTWTITYNNRKFEYHNGIWIEC